MYNAPDILLGFDMIACIVACCQQAHWLQFCNADGIRIAEHPLSEIQNRGRLTTGETSSTLSYISGVTHGSCDNQIIAQILLDILSPLWSSGKRWRDLREFASKGWPIPAMNCEMWLWQGMSTLLYLEP